jgi:flagellar biosynthesis/type III secretory pathway M-ring protein FliF/YscJ
VEAILIILALALVVWVVSAPLRRGEAPEVADAAQRDALEAARDAKYREIRDAELDWRTGKLSDEDYREQDRRLRAEAVEILRELDRLS